MITCHECEQNHAIFYMGVDMRQDSEWAWKLKHIILLLNTAIEAVKILWSNWQYDDDIWYSLVGL